MRQKYLMAAAGGKIRFAGRLGMFRYYDMHQAIGSGLKLSERLCAPFSRRVWGRNGREAGERNPAGEAGSNQ